MSVRDTGRTFMILAVKKIKPIIVKNGFKEESKRD